MSAAREEGPAAGVPRPPRPLPRWRQLWLAAATAAWRVLTHRRALPRAPQLPGHPGAGREGCEDWRDIGGTTPSQVDLDNAAFYQRQAADAFARGQVCWGLYYLDAADFYAEPSPEQVSERVELLLAAMGTLGGRRGTRPPPPATL